jgi:hypothetical protein
MSQTLEFKMAGLIRKNLKKRGDTFWVATNGERMRATRVFGTIKEIVGLDFDVTTRQHYEGANKKGFKVVAI